MSVLSLGQLLKLFDSYGGCSEDICKSTGWIDPDLVTPGMRKRFQQAMDVPANVLVPTLPAKDAKCGVFKYEPLNIDEEYAEVAVENCLFDMAYRNRFSIFDFHCVYRESSYPDNDGAGIFLNVNPDSALFGRVMTYHSIDDDYYALLSPECTLERVLLDYEAFQPKIEISGMMDGRKYYFVDHIREKYEVDQSR